MPPLTSRQLSSAKLAAARRRPPAWPMHEAVGAAPAGWSHGGARERARAGGVMRGHAGVEERGSARARFAPSWRGWSRGAAPRAAALGRQAAAHLSGAGHRWPGQ
eukprot:scaffold1146_cov399-Prasinococcus_capsulatus_cf.AAC.28